MSDKMPEDATLHSIPIVEERLNVDKLVRSNSFRVSARTHAANVDVDEVLRSVRADVERVPIDRFVDDVPQIEERDGVTVIPVIEEVLVRRLLLREELHVRQVVEERRHTETVTLRYQDPAVERIEDEES